VPAQKDFHSTRAKRTGEAIGARAAAETAEASGRSVSTANHD